MVAGDPTPAMVRFAGYDAYGVEPINLVGQMNAPANACGGLHALRREHQRLSVLGYVPRLDDAGQHDDFGRPDAHRRHAVRAVLRRSAAAGHAPTASIRSARTSCTAPTRVHSRPTRRRASRSSSTTSCRAPCSRAASTGSTSTSTTTARRSRRRRRSTRRCSQEGVYAPDAKNRWMGGIAIDGSGNIGVGFSKSSLDHAPADHDLGPHVRGSAGHARRRDELHRRHRQRLADEHQRPLGRLFVDERRSGRPVHVLLHERVLPDDGWLLMAHARVQLQVRQLRPARLRTRRRRRRRASRCAVRRLRPILRGRSAPAC